MVKEMIYISICWRITFRTLSIIQYLCMRKRPIKMIDTKKRTSRHEPKNKSPLIPAIPDVCFLIADKYGASNRFITEFAAGFLSAHGDLSKYALSVKTTERRRSFVRSNYAQTYKTNHLKDHQFHFYALHWDSKKLKSQSHTKGDLERVAVVLSGKNP